MQRRQLLRMPMMAALQLPASSPGTGSLISWWTLNEASGTRSDSHGSNHLADNNTVTYNAAGKKGNAASFVAANSEWLSIASNASLQTGAIDFTVGVWVKPTGTADIYISGKGDSTHSTTEWDIYVPGFAGNFYPYFSSLALDQAYSGDTWIFIVAWRDQAANKIYIQGDNGTVYSQVSNATSAGTSGFAIGRAGEFDSSTMNGLIDEVFFYKKVLTPAQRSWLYNDGNGRTYADL